MADRKCGNEKTRNRMKAKQSHPILRVLFILERKKGQGLLRQTEEETPVHLTPPKSASPSCGTQACGAVQCHRIVRLLCAGRSTPLRSARTRECGILTPCAIAADLLQILLASICSNCYCPRRADATLTGFEKGG